MLLKFEARSEWKDWKASENRITTKLHHSVMKKTEEKKIEKILFRNELMSKEQEQVLLITPIPNEFTNTPSTG